LLTGGQLPKVKNPTAGQALKVLYRRRFARTREPGHAYDAYHTITIQLTFRDAQDAVIRMQASL
jgi:hypothetical protein